MKSTQKLTALCLGSVLVFTLLLGTPFMDKKAYAFTTANADTAMSAFVSAFYDSSAKYFYTNSDHVIHSEHAYGPDGGLYTDFWWEAQLWETVMDAYQRTGSATYRTMIDDIYTGFNAKYTNMTDNQFNDDLAWWALACLRAYEITGTVEYLNRGSYLFDSVYSSWNTSSYGGGIWWRKDATDPNTSINAQKNMATNAPMIMIAIKLKNAYGNSAYLTKAQLIYNWAKSTLVNGSKVNDHIQGTGAGIVKDWDFTYNYGTFLGAALALYKDTNTASYLTDANNAANYVIDKMTSSTTLMYEGENDAPGFKMIFARNLNQLRVQASQTQYLTFLQQNATQAWNHRRTSDNIIGSDWLKPTDSTYVQSLAAAAGASIMQFVPADGYTGNIAGNGVYEAENARRTLAGGLGMINESTNTGFYGRGYVAGWNTNATSIDFYINQNFAGSKTITIRYAAAAGNASRYVNVNGVNAAANLTFNGTSNWSSWNTVSLNVSLQAGSNTIQLGYDNSKGNSNYLNVDQLIETDITYEAEAAALHSLSTESTNSGYTGTGYVAGWNANSQWVDFNVNATAAGTYNLTFRYAGGAGNATRYVYVNGAGVVNNQLFTGTGSWTSYNTVTIPNVHLNSGSNTISLIFDSVKGSSNWLNLDNLKVSRIS